MFFSYTVETFHFELVLRYINASLKEAAIGSYNVLSPIRHQAITLNDFVIPADDLGYGPLYSIYCHVHTM